MRVGDELLHERLEAGVVGPAARRSQASSTVSATIAFLPKCSGELLALDRLEEEGRAQAGARIASSQSASTVRGRRHARPRGDLDQPLLAAQAARDVGVGRQRHVGELGAPRPSASSMKADVLVALGEEDEAARRRPDAAQVVEHELRRAPAAPSGEHVPAAQVASSVRPNSLSCRVMPWTSTPARPRPRAIARPACSMPKTTGGGGGRSGTARRLASRGRGVDASRLPPRRARRVAALARPLRPAGAVAGARASRASRAACRPAGRGRTRARPARERWRPCWRTSSGSRASAPSAAASASPSPGGHVRAAARPPRPGASHQPSRLTTTGWPAASESKNLSGELVCSTGWGANIVKRDVGGADDAGQARAWAPAAGRAGCRGRARATRASSAARWLPSPTATSATSSSARAA